MICVFDIETIPDVRILRKKLDAQEMQDLNDLQLCEFFFEKQKEKSGSEFLPIYLHQIVSISSVIADEYGNFIKVGNFGKKEDILSPHYEKALISDFINYINKHNPKLVSYNGRMFDLPVIMLRAMSYNLSATAYYENENPHFNKTKWENYRQKFSERFHTDLLECLSHFGSARGMRLDDVCMMLNIPGKYDLSGDRVHQIYHDTTRDFAENMTMIEEYCQSDVLNTYWVYLKYEILKGALSLQDYHSILQGFLQKLPKDKPYSAVFSQSLERELDHVRNTLD